MADPNASVLPLHRQTADVTRDEHGHVYLRAGFSEIRIPHADALVLAADLLAAHGYTYEIHRIEAAS